MPTQAPWRCPAEFTAWLAARSSARGGVTVLDCTPEDVAVFFESNWLLKHGSMQLAGGGLHAAPSYLDSSVSHLSGMFKRLGREGPYSYSHKVRFASFMGLAASAVQVCQLHLLCLLGIIDQACLALN